MTVSYTHLLTYGTASATIQVTVRAVRSIVSIIKTASNGSTDTYTITYSDGTTETFTQMCIRDSCSWCCGTS